MIYLRTRNQLSICKDINKYSEKLTRELGKGYSTRSLKYMRKFYLLQKGQRIAAKLSWSHYIELLKFKDMNKVNYYINLSLNLNLSRDDLRYRIKNKEYERIDENTRKKIVNNETVELIDTVKNPILIRNTLGIENK